MVLRSLSCCHRSWKSLLLFQLKKVYLSVSKVKLTQANNRCKTVVEATKLGSAKQTKMSSTSHKCGCRNFWRVPNGALVFEWFSMERLLKNIQLMPVFLKDPFFFLHFSYHISVAFLMMSPVILLSMIRHLILDNN